MIKIENLHVEYYRRNRVIPAVRDFTLDIGPGESVGLVGESGSGKSTVALAILRLIRAQEGRITSGRIAFQGEDLLGVSTERIREIRGRHISMIFQDPFTSLNPVMRVRDQLDEIYLPVAGRLSLAESLERVQLDPKRVLEAYPHQLSGGQRQRVMIAMALLRNPEFILADEPTTALDVLVQKDILDLLFTLQKQLQLGILFISHNLSLVACYTQRLAIMKEGQVVEQGTTQDLLHRPTHPYTRQLWAATPRISSQK
jgi:ABC-type dipeptide/oligopeptide/nickel transport system ATPase component